MTPLDNVADRTKDIVVNGTTYTLKHMSMKIQAEFLSYVKKSRMEILKMSGFKEELVYKAIKEIASSCMSDDVMIEEIFAPQHRPWVISKLCPEINIEEVPVLAQYKIIKDILFLSGLTSEGSSESSDDTTKKK